MTDKTYIEEILESQNIDYITQAQILANIKPLGW
jgi:hypothetical protein